MLKPKFGCWYLRSEECFESKKRDGAVVVVSRWAKWKHESLTLFTYYIDIWVFEQLLTTQNNLLPLYWRQCVSDVF